MAYDGKRNNRYGVGNVERGTGVRGNVSRSAVDRGDASCGSAGSGSAGCGSTGFGSAGCGSTGSGSAGRGSAGFGSAGYGNADRRAADGRGSDRRNVRQRGQSPVIGKRLSPKAREVFLEGLRRYQERGVRIMLDGKVADVKSLEVIFEEREDGSFYMGDYILAEEEELALRTGQKCCGGCEIMALHENQSGYRTQEEGMDPAADAGKAAGKNGKGGVKCLKEIRFDRVYNR